MTGTYIRVPCEPCKGTGRVKRKPGAFIGFGRHDRRRRPPCQSCYGRGWIEVRESKPKCKCGADVTGLSHTCPYREDIRNDSETLCDCCASCARECAQEI